MTAVPTAAALEARLREKLAPTALEVIDESAAHAGHAGANGLGYGTHFRVRIAAPAFVGLGRVALSGGQKTEDRGRIPDRTPVSKPIENRDSKIENSSISTKGPRS